MRLATAMLVSFLSTFVMGQTAETARRLSALNLEVPLTYNGYVQQAIDDLLENKNGLTEEILGKSSLYLPDVEDSLRKYGLPGELQFLLPALSSYDLWKVSDDGGSGFWQMRYLTAKRYGLKISSYVDERRDFRKATSAAIPYLKHLYDVFGDWQAVMVAFVADEVEVNKAIRMAGGDSSYWEYHRFLPTRFQSVVPSYIASVYIHSYYKELKLQPKAIVPEDWTKVEVDRWLTLFQLSEALQLDFNLIKDANAIYKKQVIPDTEKKYLVNIPSSSVEKFNELGDSIYRVPSHKHDDTVEPEPQAKEDRPKVEEPAVVKPATPTGNRLIYYTVRKGDYLGRIADMYDCGISDVKRWNKLRSDRINVNQRLKIYKPASQYSKYNKINTMSTYQQNQLIKKD